MMNHCISCGRHVSRGRTHTDTHAVRCLVCATAQALRDWRFETAVMKLRKQDTKGER